jgi:hypothetical protein
MASPQSAALFEARQTTCFVFTDEHRRFLDELDPGRFEAATLRQYFEAFNETEAEGVERPMLDGIQLFRDAVARVNETTAAILVIG